MAEITATCACGRQMTERGTDARGTFSCGCGARVIVTVYDRATCIGLSEADRRCGFLPVREATQFGLSLCRQHFEGYLDVLEKIRIAENQEILTPEPLLEPLDWQARRAMYETQSVVYYVRIRDTIKIGYTVNMKARFSNLLIDEVLATEPGGEELERVRHRQFAALRIRGERFRPEPELMSHIAMIRDHFGEPVMTGYLYEDGVPVRSWGELRQRSGSDAVAPAS